MFNFHQLKKVLKKSAANKFKMSNFFTKSECSAVTMDDDDPGWAGRGHLR